jgi:serine/threonine-protein kinase RsbT
MHYMPAKNTRMILPKQIPLYCAIDVAIARTTARDAARQLGFRAVDQARIATATSELARNIILYARTGIVHVRSVEQHERQGIEIICEDQGPGITNSTQVLQNNDHTLFVRGLPGTKHLMDEFVLHSQEGLGTTVICRKWREQR